MKAKILILKSLVSLSVLPLLTNCPSPPQARIDKGNLIITEVGSCPYLNSPGWIEVYNPTPYTTYLSSYKLRTSGWQYVGPDPDDYDFYSDFTFTLPDLTIYPGSYALIRGEPFAGLVDGAAVVYISTSEGIFPNWHDPGDVEGRFAELVRGGLSVDFVRFGPSFGTNIAVPTSAGQWLDDTAPSLPSTGNESDVIVSVARDGANTDSNDYLDWTLRLFSTPGGPNDVTGAFTDGDDDGIPDSCEVAGSTFAGLPLYEWGTRTGQRDLFIHIDYMDSADEGVIPRKEALERVKDVFLSQNIHLHFDVGDLYDQAVGIDPMDWDLEDTSHRVPFAKGITLGEWGDGRANLYAYKYNYMDLARKPIFHYIIFGYTQNANGSAGSSGLAELNGNDFLVTLGNLSLSSSNAEETNLLVNFQASTFMHELGHNLGLRHGGDENLNFKPNYISIMNYLYQLWGLPAIGNNEGDRFHLEWFVSDPMDRWSEIANLTNGPFGDPSSFLMDYSDGSGADIDEGSNDETLGLRRTGTDGVDYDNNGSLGIVSVDINDDGGDGTLNNGDETTALHDYDDWSDLNFFFATNFMDDIYGKALLTIIDTWVDPIGDDRQPIYPEPPLRIPVRN